MNLILFITGTNQSYNFMSYTSNFDIDFPYLGLSGEININIIAKDNKGRLSDQATITASI